MCEKAPKNGSKLLYISSVHQELNKSFSEVIFSSKTSLFNLVLKLYIILNCLISSERLFQSLIALKIKLFSYFDFFANDCFSNNLRFDRSDLTSWSLRLLQFNNSLCAYFIIEIFLRLSTFSKLLFFV